MQTTPKSREMRVQIPAGAQREQVLEAVQHATGDAGLFISHIGGYSRTKYPGAVHWHFKRDKKEKGVLDATYWADGPLFWLTLRNNEPQWVHDAAPRLQDAVAARIAKLS